MRPGQHGMESGAFHSPTLPRERRTVPVDEEERMLSEGCPNDPPNWLDRFNRELDTIHLERHRFEGFRIRSG